MTRRAFLIAVPALPAAFAAWGQQTGRVFRVGIVLTTTPLAELVGPEPIQPRVRAFVRELRRLGYAEGQNLILDRRSAEGKFDRFGEILGELLRLKPDVLVTFGVPMALTAKKLTNSIPIVMLGATDPVAAGIVPNLARPGGNVTGVLGNTGPEITAKRLEILKATAPGASRVAYLAQKGNGNLPKARLSGARREPSA